MPVPGSLPETTCSFDKLLEGLTEFTQSGYTCGYSLPLNGISQGRDTERKVPGVEHLAVLLQRSRGQHQLCLPTPPDNTRGALSTRKARLSFGIQVLPGA